MRSLDDAVEQFVFHPATPASAVQHARVRELFVDLLANLWEQVPDGPEKTLAVRKLQESLMYANLAIALTAPADVSPTRSVARVLPLEDPQSFGFRAIDEALECVNKGGCDCS